MWNTCRLCGSLSCAAPDSGAISGTLASSSTGSAASALVVPMNDVKAKASLRRT